MRMPPAHCTRGSRISAQTSWPWRSRMSRSSSAARSAQSAGVSPSRARYASGEGAKIASASSGAYTRRYKRNIADRERADRFAVVTVLQRDELRALRLPLVAEPVEGHLQRDFHARRAVVGVEDLRERRAAVFARREREQAFGERDRGLVREAGEDHLFERPGLLGDRTRDARLGMAEQVGPPARHRVEVALPVHADQPRALAACDGDQRQDGGVLAHLRAGVPQHREVARYHRVEAVHSCILRP